MLNTLSFESYSLSAEVQGVSPSTALFLRDIGSPLDKNITKIDHISS